MKLYWNTVTPVPLYIVYGCFHDRVGELRQRPDGLQCLKYLLSGPLQKKVCHPWSTTKIAMYYGFTAYVKEKRITIAQNVKRKLKYKYLPAIKTLHFV